MKKKLVSIIFIITICICFNDISSIKAENKIPKEALKWNDHYYLYMDASLNWKEAKEDCKKRGGHLVTITSQEENDFLFNNLVKYHNKDVMIGLSDEKVENNWEWVNGETFEYSNWQSGEPNNENNEDFVLMRSDNGKWNDGHLEREKWNYICEWDSLDKENDNEYFKKTGNNYKYTGKALPSKIYQIPGNLIIDKQMEFINKSKPCKIVAKNITIKSCINFSKNTYLESEEKFTVEKNGTINMSKKSEILAGGDFVYNSGKNSNLDYGIIKIGKNAVIKRNFYPGKENEVWFLKSNKMHKINMYKTKPRQYFNILRIKGNGIEALNIKETFECKNGMIPDNWDILKMPYYGEEFSLSLDYLGSSPKIKSMKDIPEQVKSNIQVAIMRTIYEKGRKGSIFDGFDFVSVDEKDLIYYYYNKKNKKILYKFDINYSGVQMMGSVGFGNVTYTENGKVYSFILNSNKEVMNKAIKDFQMAVKSHIIVESGKEVILNTIKSNIIDELPDSIKEVYKITEALKENKDYIEAYFDIITMN